MLLEPPSNHALCIETRGSERIVRGNRYAPGPGVGIGAGVFIFLTVSLPPYRLLIALFLSQRAYRAASALSPGSVSQSMTKHPISKVSERYNTSHSFL